MCAVGHTYHASLTAHITDGMDVLIHEAKDLADKAGLVYNRVYLLPVVAADVTKNVKDKRVILYHTSVCYSGCKCNSLENEARLALEYKKCVLAR